ncbi:hypothetical protein [Brachybacterium epidermidis]|uniref:hypothetical protein n=1 Tax=Brachybacterium epidermidis TaxID=2781983 RepID=UPI00398E5F45
MIRRSRAARIKLIALATTLMIALGTGGAAAYWTATAQVEGSATGASVGLSQSDPVNLEVSYDAGKLAAVDTVTVRNTGTAPAGLTTTVAAGNGSALAGVLRFTVAPVADAAQCTPGASLAGAVTGGSGVSFTTTLDAGASTLLCVRSSLPARSAFLHAGATVGVTVTSTLTYAEGAAWTLTSSGMTGAPVMQRVVKDPAAGLPAATCTERNFWDHDTWYALRFDFPASGEAREYRAYLVYDGRTRDLPHPIASFSTNGGSVNTMIPDAELAPVVGDLPLGTSRNVRIVFEQRRTGDQEWTNASTAQYRVDGRWPGQDDPRCGWR